MAHKKAGGSSRNGRDSKGQRRGVKRFGGQLVKPGEIIVRQVGSTFHAGTNAKEGKDYTIFSVVKGFVNFHTGKNNRKFISIIPSQE